MIVSADDFRGQEKLRLLLGRYLAHGKLGGTLLLLGQRGLGKTTLATIIARALCCERNQSETQRPLSAGEAEPASIFDTGLSPDHSLDAPDYGTATSDGIVFCGQCYACRTIASGNQPEFVTIRPKGQDIKVEQFDEELDGLRSASLHPLHLARRIFLFDDAHCLNTTTANQLLKLLEEPPARTVFILVTDQPDKLLPTIRSRGVPFTLSAVSRWQLEEFIRVDLPELDSRGVREAAYLAGGRYVDALALGANPDWRSACCALAQALAGRGDVLDCGSVLQEHEFAALWNKLLRDSGLTDDEAQKLVDKPRINELKRQALAMAYDRAAWWLLHEAARGLEYYPGADRRRPAPVLPSGRFGPALALLKQRIHSNVDPQLAQAAFEAGI